MFIMPFAREVRLAQTKPTRAPVLGFVPSFLSTPPMTGSQHLPRPLRAAGKRASSAILLLLSTFCPAVEMPCGIPGAGRKLGAVYKKPSSHTEGQISRPLRLLFLCVPSPCSRSPHRTLTSCHARRSKWVCVPVEPGETDEEGPCKCYFG